MSGGEPVPVPARVRRAGLFGVGDKERLTLGEAVHAGSVGEGRCCLGAAVQHHQQGHRPAGITGWDVQPIGAGTGSVGVGEGVKLARLSLEGRPRAGLRGRTRSLRAGKARRRRIRPDDTRLSGICFLIGWREAGGEGSMPLVSSSAYGASGMRLTAAPGLVRVCCINAVASTRRPWRVRRVASAIAAIWRASMRDPFSGLSSLASSLGGGEVRARRQVRHPGPGLAVVIAAAQTVRAMKTAFTFGRGPGRRRVPVPRQSWLGPARGEKSAAILASPSTRIWIICPASRISSRSRRV